MGDTYPITKNLNHLVPNVNKTEIPTGWRERLVVPPP
jgi:hypothetical protein